MKKENDRIVVGLDISLTSTGLAILTGDEHKLYLVKTKPQQFPTVLERIRWIGLSIRQKLKLHIGESSPKDIFYGIEDYALNSRLGKMIDRAEATGFIKQVLWTWTGRQPILCHPMTLKKFICGRGRVEKTHHLSYALEKWKIMFPNDDVCDAYAVARLTKALVCGESDLYEYEKDCVETVRKYATNELVLKVE